MKDKILKLVRGVLRFGMDVMLITFAIPLHLTVILETWLDSKFPGGIC